MPKPIPAKNKEKLRYMRAAHKKAIEQLAGRHPGTTTTIQGILFKVFPDGKIKQVQKLELEPDFEPYRLAVEMLLKAPPGAICIYKGKILMKSKGGKISIVSSKELKRHAKEMEKLRDVNPGINYSKGWIYTKHPNGIIAISKDVLPSEIRKLQQIATKRFPERHNHFEIRTIIVGNHAFSARGAKIHFFREEGQRVYEVESASELMPLRDARGNFVTRGNKSEAGFAKFILEDLSIGQDVIGENHRYSKPRNERFKTIKKDW